MCGPVFVGVLAAMLAQPISAVEFPGVDEWSLQQEAERYDTDGLWEYINGDADVYLAYGFRQVDVGELSRDGVVASVGIYDMGTALNAFGIYRREAASDAETLRVGVEATGFPPYQWLLLKDRFYVKVDIYEGEMQNDGAVSLLESIANALPGRDTYPEELALLPEAGIVPGSVGFTRESFLGMRELTNCIHARYGADDESEFQLFIVLPGHGASGEDVWKQLAAKWSAVETSGRLVLSREVPYRGPVGITLTDRGVMGVADCSDQEQMLRVLSEIE